ncbi:hypothetical protein L208DRAFT_1559943, partial [Tricholoma matsutake]
FLQGQVHFSPDIYLSELQELLEEQRGVEISDATLYRSPRRSGFTLMKLTQEALECSEAKRLAFRHQYGSRYTPEQTVFVDESSFDHRTSI